MRVSGGGVLGQHTLNLEREHEGRKETRGSRVSERGERKEGRLCSLSPSLLILCEP